MKRRALLAGLAGLIAAPAVLRLGAHMPLRKLSAVELDPADINGIIAELPDGATWVADPNVAYWADKSLRIVGKADLDLRLNNATVLLKGRTVDSPEPGIHIAHCRHVDLCDATIRSGELIEPCLSRKVQSGPVRHWVWST